MLMSRKIIKKVQKFFYFGQRLHSDYISFLNKAKATGRLLQPLNEYHTASVTTKIIGLRHDVDVSLDWAIKLAEVENSAGARSTYFILHTAEYFFSDIRKRKLNQSLITKLQYLQNQLGHEIGLHTDLITAKNCYGWDQEEFLEYTLELLRKNGIRVHGISSHGTLFKEKFLAKTQKPVNNVSWRILGDDQVDFELSRFGLTYEAGAFQPDLYFSDAQFINGKRCDFSNFPMALLTQDSDIIVSTHPIHWAESIVKYYINGLFQTVNYMITYIKHYLAHKLL